MKRINPCIWQLCVTLFIVQSLFLLGCFAYLGLLVAYNEGPWSHSLFGFVLFGDHGGLVPAFYYMNMCLSMLWLINRANSNK